MAGEPTLGGAALAVLLLGAVLRGDEFRRQRQHLMVAGSDDGGAQEGMEAFHPAIGAAAGRAIRALDFARAEILGAIQRDQDSPAKALESGR